MKQLIMTLSVFVVTGAFAQTTIKKKKEYTENGITKGYEVIKELDQHGNIISYDSIPFKRQASPDDFQFKDFDRSFGDMGMDMPTEFPEMEQFTQSMLSFTDAMMTMTDSIMSRFMGPDGMPSFGNMDQYMNGMDSFFDDIPREQMMPKEEQFIIPESQKKKNRKT